MIRSRARVEVARVVELAYAVRNIRELQAALSEFDSPLTLGLIDRKKEAFDFADMLKGRQTRAFQHVLGPHCHAIDFHDAVHALVSPCYYVNSAGFAVWANKAMLIHSAFLLRGDAIFSN